MEELRSLESIKTLDELTGALNTELNRAAISFVRIGYLLKTARDTDVLKDTQYANINEYAADKFGLDKSQVSRFININDRFSIGGYSEHLKTEYEGYGQAKLSLMLTLPDELNAELSPEYSKADIQTVKEEYEAEQNITPIEAALEERPDDLPDEFIEMIIKALNDEEQEAARLIKESVDIGKSMGLEIGYADAQEAYMPEGDTAYSVRIPGVGRFLISMKESMITITNVRTMEKSPLGWDEFAKVCAADVEHREFAAHSGPKEKKGKTERVKKPKKSKYQVEVERFHEQNDIKPQKTEQNDINPQKAEEMEEETHELPYPDNVEPEITHVSPEDPLPEEEIKVLDQRELERIANGLRSLADEFERGTGGNLYDRPVKELEGMKDEIEQLSGELIPIIEDAIKRKQA